LDSNYTLAMPASEETVFAPAYDIMLGTGGIGSGTFFALSGNHTLGREESRGGTFLDQRDYCKLHIICHYVHKLAKAGFKTLPIGKVGDDAEGTRLIAEMHSEGLDLSLTTVMSGEPTLNCICLLYPDGSGGNLTVNDSASGQVIPEDINKAEPWFQKFAGRGIALAVPEVPLPARVELLSLAGKHNCLRAASFASEEMDLVRESSLLKQVDLLAINLDEAAHLAGLGTEGDAETIVKKVATTLGQQYPQLRLSITAGAIGSWTYDGTALHFIATPQVAVESAAGAGDAHFSGILAGLAAGLKLADAQWLGILAGAMSVTSPHTIHPGIDRASLYSFAMSKNLSLPETVTQFFN
jgi:sugar/nucleoside kinase (ribokinase family)